MTTTSPVYDSYPYFKNLEKLTNIKIAWDTVSSADYDQKKSLVYASGEYPDAIMCGTSVTDEEKYGVEQKILIPIEKYVNTRMPNYKKALETKEEFKKIATATDGHMYSTLSLYEMGYQAGGQYFVNKKWLDKFGLKAPKTVEELENVLSAFKTKDSNGNGKVDEIPYIDMYKTFLQKNYANTLGYLCFSAADNDRITKMSTDINKYVTQNVIQMITEGNIDAAWDKYTSQYKSMGLDDYIKIYQTALDKFNGAK